MKKYLFFEKKSGKIPLDFSSPRRVLGGRLAAAAPAPLKNWSELHAFCILDRPRAYSPLSFRLRNRDTIQYRHFCCDLKPRFSAKNGEKTVAGAFSGWVFVEIFEK